MGELIRKFERRYRLKMYIWSAAALVLAALCPSLARAGTIGYTFDSPEFQYGFIVPSGPLAPQVGGVSMTYSTPGPNVILAASVADPGLNPNFSGQFVTAEDPHGGTNPNFEPNGGPITLNFSAAVQSLSLDWDLPGDSEPSAVYPFQGYPALQLNSSSGNVAQNANPGFPGGHLTYAPATPFTSVTLDGVDSFGVDEQFNLDNLQLNLGSSSVPDLFLYNFDDSQFQPDFIVSSNPLLPELGAVSVSYSSSNENVVLAGDSYSPAGPIGPPDPNFSGQFITAENVNGVMNNHFEPTAGPITFSFSAPVDSLTFDWDLTGDLNDPSSYPSLGFPSLQIDGPSGVTEDASAAYAGGHVTYAPGTSFTSITLEGFDGQGLDESFSLDNLTVTSADPAASQTSAPEPASLLLAGTAFALAGLRLRKSR